jgi:hypothetical protein
MTSANASKELNTATVAHSHWAPGTQLTYRDGIARVAARHEFGGFL